MCVFLSACVCPLMEAMMCVVIFVPLFICPGHNKPITRADGEGWVMRAPSPSGDETGRDRWRLSADAGRAALALAGPPNTWDRGDGVTQQQEQQQLLQPSWFQVSKPQFVLWWIKSAESLIALAELRPLSAQAPITVWYIEFLARAWSSLLAFQTGEGGGHW